MRGGAINNYARAAGINQTTPDKVDRVVPLTAEDLERGLWDLHFTASQVGGIGGCGAEYGHLIKLVL